ncbi:tautomerase family protein [Pseudorhodoferax sp. Leaf274]|uniref:tautomerase family protein n=1 Tax=Pseudorhodoferax sp. Leaf274 TaxID=1736318 RepID=UPI0007028E93|nr:tautomerase family protein [Pseudorhodoferax sp. Leaf274]KQP38098.1 hypothetical protein ASF44_12860 [Pseudorhodoferax sp. Leaf274]
MPFVRIDLPDTVSPQDAQALGDAVHQALVATFEVPPDDRFQVLARHAPGALVCTPSYLGVAHSARVALVQVTCSFGRTPAHKRALYARIVQNAAQAGFAAADVVIHLVETARENWSFGEGVAHYAPAAS